MIHSEDQPIPALPSAYQQFNQMNVGKPLMVLFEIGQRCNLRCGHCYNFDRSVSQPSRYKDELSDQEILNTIDAVVEAGAFELTFSGGESLLHPGLLTFIARAREHTCSVRLKTNAVLLTDPILDQLDALGVAMVDTSIYGSNAETHDAMTGVKGSFDKTLAACERVAKRDDMLLNVFVSVTGSNYRQLHEIESIFGPLGARTRYNIDITGRYDGTVDSIDYALTEEQIEYCYRAYPEWYNLEGLDGIFDRSQAPQCRCAEDKCAIAANGDVYPCIGAPLTAGNIRQTPFIDIWQKSNLFESLRRLKANDFPACEPCPLRKYCIRSSGSAYSNTGDYLGADPQACSHARVRERLSHEPQPLTSAKKIRVA